MNPIDSPAPKSLPPDSDPAQKAASHEYASQWFDLFPFGAALLDPETGSMRINPVLRRLLGYDGAPEPKDIRSLLHPDELPRSAAWLSRLTTGVFPCAQADLRLIRSSGEPLRCRMHAMRPLTETGLFPYVLLQIQIMPDKTRLQARTTVSFAQLDAMLESFPYPLVMVNQEWICTYMNKAAELFLEATREELLGRSLWDSLPQVDTCLYRECMRSAAEMIPIRIQETMPSGRTFEINGYPTEDGMCLFARDASAAQEQETAYVHTKLMLNSMIRHMPDAVAIMDCEYRIVQVNPAYVAAFGYKEDELLGNFPLPIPAALKEETCILLRQALQFKQLHTIETKRRHKDGRMFDVSLSIWPIIAEDQNVIALTLILRDITGRKQGEELLRFADKLSVAGRLAAGVAHEIRNPLTALKGFTQFMKQNAQYKEHYFSIMLAEMTRIEQTLNELLLLTSPQTLPLLRRRVEPILREALGQLEKEAELQGVELKPLFPIHLAEVRCDENHLKQVFVSLIRNGIEAMPQGGAITVDCCQTDERTLSVTFADQGVGIPEELLQRVGEPFFTTKEKGTGLGLVISKKWLHDLGGSLHIASTEGRGTKVTVLLPIG
ncbi:Sporulation kinase A [Paenibacillus konkukensis]|uniref:histidine kinase n=1 Tax=Paenibacillus konkukensis TaxID=2020716 RepID=A0ABY4RT85_9BACL|nr:PAS domain-containing sensor histidine kinase [Paenibacillus konkukensis]UQZ85187.1 Sporulation kinase A [Paenibacillus konkukensis]